MRADERLPATVHGLVDEIYLPRLSLDTGLRWRVVEADWTHRKGRSLVRVVFTAALPEDEQTPECVSLAGAIEVEGRGWTNTGLVEALDREMSPLMRDLKRLREKVAA